MLEVDLEAMADHYSVRVDDLRLFLDHLEAHAAGRPPPDMAPFVAMAERLESQVGRAKVDTIRRRLVRDAGLNLKVR